MEKNIRVEPQIRQASKVRIYIDASNIIMGFKGLDKVVDFLNLKIYLEDRFRTKDVFYFTPNMESLKEDLTKIESAGFVIIKKDVYYQNKFKANCDVEIAHHITRDIKDGLADKVVLLSGDGDFSILLEFANQNNIKVNVLSVNKQSTAKLLRKKSFYKIEYLNDLEDIFVLEYDGELK